MPFFPNVSLFSRTSSEWKEILYDDREICSRPAPLVYNFSLNTTHFVAVPIYLAAFWTLKMESSPNFKVYKKYLAVHAVFNMMFEFHLSLIMKPVLYLPYLVARCTGFWILAFINGGILFFILVFLIISTLWSILELFYFRFKSIYDSDLCNNWVKKYAVYALVSRYILVFMTFATLGALAICVVGLFQQNELKAKLPISTTHPEILCMSAMMLPRTNETGFRPIHLFNSFIAISSVVGLLLVFSLVAVSFVTLQQMVNRTHLSIRTINMQRRILFSLIGQISVHCLMLGFPFTVYIISAGFGGGDNDVGYVAIVFTSLHGTMSTLAMILMNRPLLNVASSVFSGFVMVFRDTSVHVSRHSLGV